jgi:hypothetical protein
LKNWNIIKKKKYNQKQADKYRQTLPKALALFKRILTNTEGAELKTKQYNEAIFLEG